MWLFTPGGVYMPGLIPEKHIPADRPDRVLQVRTRRRIDLERLRDSYMGEELGEILESPGMDYNFRAYCSLEAWAKACYKMALDIDYVKFKEQTEKKFPGPEGKKLHSVYTSIWSTLTALGRPYAGGGDTPMVKLADGSVVPEQKTGTYSWNSSWDYSDHDAFYSSRPTGKVSFPVRSDAERALDLLDALDGQLITEEECWAEMARLPENAWAEFVRDHERETILARQRTANHRKARKNKKFGRKKVS